MVDAGEISYQTFCSIDYPCMTYDTVWKGRYILESVKQVIAVLVDCACSSHHSMRINDKLFGGPLIEIGISFGCIIQRNDLHVDSISNLDLVE